MRRSLKIFLAFTTVSLLLYQIDAYGNLPFQICSRTIRPSYCYKIIVADPRTNLQSSVEGICRIIVDKALMISVFNMGRISDLVKRSAGTYNQILRDCYGGYKLAHDVLQHANISVIDRGTYHSVAAAVSYPYHNAEACEREFQQTVPAFPSPLTQENKNLEGVIYIAMQIVNLKVCNQTGVCWGYLKMS